MAKQAFAGLKVVELGSWVSAPYLGKLLADYGAEVIKVEPPEGDPARRLGPFPGDLPHPEKSGMFLFLNTNKLGITLNLRNAAGKRILFDLLKDTDILVENLPPGEVDDLGISYERLQAINPKIVMVSLTHFGQTGPYRDYKGSELISAALGGVANDTPIGGVGAENLHLPPLKAWGWQAGLSCAANAGWATVAALLVARRTGRGQHVDASEVESVAAQMRPIIPETSYLNPPYSTEQQPEGWAKNRRVGTGSSSIMMAQDGYVNLQPSSEPQWRGFKRAMGNPEWAESEIFATVLSRADNREVWRALAAEWVGERTKAELYHLLQENRVPCFPINTPEDVVNDPHNVSRGIFTEQQHHLAGVVKHPGAPFILSKTPWELQRPAPQLGQHNEEILGQRLGHRPEELTLLRTLGAI